MLFRSARGRTPSAVERKLDKVTPDRYRLHAHHWLILHGRYACKARKPSCSTCAVADLCGWRKKAKPA